MRRGSRKARPRAGGLCALAGVCSLAAVCFFYTTYFLLELERRVPGASQQQLTADGSGKSVALCILTRRNAWDQRHLVRQTWLQDVPDGGRVGHVFVIGEDKSFTKEENARLIDEVQRYGDILIAPAEESYGTLSLKTKHCVYWATENHDFDILIKTDDDSTLFLSRLMNGWLSDVNRDDFVYFGKRHLPTKVANPANFDLDEHVNTDKYFEFDYRGVYWPEFMQGGMYGFSRRLAEEIVHNDFWTYTSEDATVGVWMSALRPEVKYLAPEHLLYQDEDYQTSNGTEVAVTFQTNPARLASMWCEYEQGGSLPPWAIRASDAQRVLSCLSKYERSFLMPASTPLGRGRSFMKATVAALSKEWPIMEEPDLGQTGAWWARMGRVFRGKAVYVVGRSASVDRLPLYMLQAKHTLVFDSFYKMQERLTTWSPTMFMCADPVICATPGESRQHVNRFMRGLFASFFLLSPGSGDTEYWRHLRQRVNVHWFLGGGPGAAAAAGEGPGMVGPVQERRGGARGVGGRGGRLKGGERRGGRAETTVANSRNFRVKSSESSLAMSIEILAYLGFSPIYLVGVEEELRSNQAEVMAAVDVAGSTFESHVKYLFADRTARLASSLVTYSDPSGASGGRARPGKFYSQESFYGQAKKLNRGRQQGSKRWDIDLFLENFPATEKVKIVHNAATIDEVFPGTPRCREGFDLDRFEHTVLCSLSISLKYFNSFLATHIPHGPVRDNYVWVKR